MGGGVKCFGPECRWHGGLEKEGSENIIGGVYGTLGNTVLGRTVGAGKSEENTV
jgi:hypothetical protein